MPQLDLEKKSENLLVEVLLPSLFALMLIGCIAHVVGIAMTAGLESGCAGQNSYAISAFAN